MPIGSADHRQTKAFGQQLTLRDGSAFCSERRPQSQFALHVRPPLLSTRFDTFAHAISITTATAPSSTRSEGRMPSSSIESCIPLDDEHPIPRCSTGIPVPIAAAIRAHLLTRLFNATLGRSRPVNTQRMVAAIFARRIDRERHEYLRARDRRHLRSSNLSKRVCTPRR